MAQKKAKIGRPKLPKGAAKGRIVPVRFTADDLKAIAVRAKAGDPKHFRLDSEHDSCQPTSVKNFKLGHYPRAIAIDIQQSLVQTFVLSERKCCMTDRIRFITHQGKQILLIDFSNCAASDVGKICREVPDFVTVLPRGSALLLSDFTGASFDEEAMRDMKQAAVFDKSHVRKSAWVGAETFPKVFSEDLRGFSRREFPAFKTREEALAWLAKD